MIRQSIHLSRKREEEGNTKKPKNNKPTTSIEEDFLQPKLANIITPLPKPHKTPIYIF